MKSLYRGLYVIICVVVIVGGAWTVSQRTEKFAEYDVTNVESAYHESEESIREREKQKMNVFYVRGEGDDFVPINMATTQNFPTFYTPGTFTYSARNYVPAYEDAVKLGNVDISRNYIYPYDEYQFVRRKDYDVNDLSRYRS